MDANLVEVLTQARDVLKAWERWEADIIEDDRCWQGDWPVITPPHYDALIPGLQERRNEAVERLTAAIDGLGQ